MGMNPNHPCHGCTERFQLRQDAHNIGIKEARIARIREQRRELNQAGLFEQIGSLGRRLTLYVDEARLDDEIDVLREQNEGDLQSTSVSDCMGLLMRTDLVDTGAPELLETTEFLCGVRAQLDGYTPEAAAEEGWLPANPQPVARLDIPRDLED